MLGPFRDAPHVMHLFRSEEGCRRGTGALRVSVRQVEAVHTTFCITVLVFFVARRLGM